MILDKLTNAHQYSGLNPGFQAAFDFLQQADLDQLAVGEYEIAGREVYAIIAKESGRLKDKALLETHERYIDIQYVIKGCEVMGWKDKTDCKTPNTKYLADTDLQFFRDAPSNWIEVNNNHFAIFFPHDAHMPLIVNEIIPDQIHKVIIKVAVK